MDKKTVFAAIGLFALAFGALAQVMTGQGSSNVPTPVDVYIDDAAWTVATEQVWPMGCYQTTDTINAGDIGAVACTTSRELKVDISSATGMTQDEDSVHTSTDPGIMSLAVRNDALTALAADGDYIPLMTDASGDLAVADLATLTEIQSFTHAEDSAHSSTHVGIMPLAIRNDSLSALAADGDYIPLMTNASGELAVEDVSTLTEIQSITYPEDQAAQAADPSVPVLAVRQDTIASLVDTDGDYSQLSVDATGRLYSYDADAVTALQIVDDWDESDRAKVNLIASQAGITGNAGAVAANTPRMTLASDDPAVVDLAAIEILNTGIETAVEVMDDWDESDRAAVNIIPSQAGITANAGAVAANTPRMTLASDDPAVTALQIVDDWDESDRAAVNIIASQAGITANAGAVAANTPRVTLASDDPAVVDLAAIEILNTGIETAVEVIDDAIFADDAAFTAGTSKGAVIMAVADAASTDSVDEDDAGALRMSLDRALAVKNEPLTIDDDSDNDCIAIPAGTDSELTLDTTTDMYLVSCVGGTGYIECGNTGMNTTTTVGQFAFAIPDGTFVKMGIDGDICGVIGTVAGGFCCFNPLHY